MKLDDSKYKYARTLTHQGVTFAFAARAGSGENPKYSIGYSILALDPAKPDDDCWTDFDLLSFPRQLRPVGMDLLTVDFGAEDIPTADAPFSVLSDGMHVYVFRQSTTGTLLVDRFVYDETRVKLANAWEVRYRRSRKVDIPESDKDTFGATDMEGNHFIEPTTELGMVKDLQNGWFSAMILPTDLQGVSRWQIFAYDTAAGKLNSFSIPRAENGLFDLSTLVRGRDGDVPPDQSFSLRLVEGSSTTDLGFATGPASLVYAKQERAKDEYGREQLVKRETRVMVAVGAVDPSSSPVGTAILDFGVGKDGKLAQVAGDLPVSPTPTIGTALAFDPLVGSAVTLPDLGITSGSAVTVEAWVRLQDASSAADVVLQSAPSAALPLSLAIVGGCPQFSVSAGGRTITAQAGPIQTGFWVHLAGTWDGSTATVYVNGQPASGAGTPPPAATIGAGYILGGANGITGHLDEVRIWNVARTRAQILAAMSASISTSDPSWNTLVGYYPLNEPSDASRLTTVPNLASPSANGTLAGARWVPTSAPRGASMSPVAWDANGLTAATTLLPSVVTAATPSLLDGSDGLIRLYYQDANQVLRAAHYDTETARAHYLVGWQAQDTNHPSNSQSGAVRFIARQCGAVMNATQTTPLLVDVGAPDDHGLATVTLRDFTGLTETWPSVPLALDAFVAVLSGQAVQASDDTVPGDRGLVSYDYTKVTVSGGGRTEPAPRPGTGSGLFAVAADGKPDNGITALVTPTATQPPALDRAGVDCWWRSDPPGAALSFASGTDHVQVLSPDQMSSYRGDLNLAGSLSLEAWINLARLPASSNAPVVFFDNPSAGAAYAFGVTPHGALFATTSRAATSPAGVIPTQQWTHVAAVYRTDYGIELSGERYLDAGDNASLSTPDALTVEAYVKLDDTGDPQIIASKWDDDAETGWKVYVDEGGVPRFEVTSTSAGDTSTFEVAGTQPLGTGQWHHVAAVYDVAKERQGAVQFSGSASSNVQIPALTNPPTSAITVEMWVHIRPSHSGPQLQEQQIMLSQQGNPIVVMVNTDENGYVQFSAAGSGQTSSVNVSSTSPLRYYGWSHLAVTYDVKSAAAAIYIDGIDVTGTPSTSSFSAGSGLGFSIGAEPAGYPFDGMMNEVRFWNVALGVDDIRRNMNRALTGAEAGLVGYWPFKDRFGTTAMDLAGTSNGTLVDGAVFVMVDKGAFVQKLLVDGERVAASTVTTPPDTGDEKLLLGATSAGGYLQGTIDDVRLWKVGRMDWQIEASLSQLVVNEEGLVAEWPFDDGSGRVAADAKGGNDAVLRDAAMQLTDAAANAMWVPTWFKAGWTLYVNGAKVPSSSMAAPNIAFGAHQLSFAYAPQTDKLPGMIGEVRIWQGERTEEQIREGMHGALRGTEDGLAGYWPMNEGSGSVLRDLSSGDCPGSWVGSATPNWQTDAPPVDVEATVVGSAHSAAAASVIEYGDRQIDAKGEAYALMKRCHAYVDPGAALDLVTGFEVGPLELQFIGQVQTRPTLVGFIEGPPPVPSENLSVDSPVYPSKYRGASKIMLAEADQSTLVYTASRNTGFDLSVDAKVGYGLGAEASAGMLFQVKLASFSSVIGAHAKFEHSLGWLSDATLSTSTSRAAKKQVDLWGSWQNNSSYDPLLGPRLWFPNNLGFALVKSGTADLYALRLKSTGAVVSYAMAPNPDIPQDVNFILFKIAPSYVKNGSLDGYVGFRKDREATDGSYFKPLEAYALKRQIEREQEQRLAWFDEFQAEAIGQRSNGTHFQSGDLGKSGNDVGAILLGMDGDGRVSEEEWRRRVANASLVNTYLWNSDGGLYAEEEQFSATREESLGGSYDFLGVAGAYAELKMMIGVHFALDALFGGHIRTKAVKTRRDGTSFGLTAEVAGEFFFNKRAASDVPVPPGEYPVPYDSDPTPGKVNQYRFMSFYLAPKKKNFDDFVSIVDPTWLNETGNPDAFSLKQALMSPNEVWRVLHRVTYVNRILPPTGEDGETLAPDVRRPDADSIAGNAALLAALPANGTNPLPTISVEADQLLTQLAANPLWGSLIAARLASLKKDIMTYMRAYHGIAG